MGEEDLQISDTRVVYYRFRNRLKDKLGGAGGGDFKISDEALAKCQEAFQSLAEDYPDWVMGNLRTLLDFHNELVFAEQGAERQRLYPKIRELAHDMKGQGGTFGYPLISKFSDSLYGFVSPNAGTSDNHIELIRSHIDSMSVVIRERIKGDGGEVGNELSKGLEQAIEKYTAVGDQKPPAAPPAKPSP